NACLAQAGGPVCAGSFSMTAMRIHCSVRIKDDLEEGLSYFYAEVKRLKRILDAALDRSMPPAFFLIDEIFKGTNNRERLLGSRAYIKKLLESQGLGLVTTHDLELTPLEKEVKGVKNFHFQEKVAGGKLVFDYRLLPGPCPTTNALRIMAQEGLPVPPGSFQ
ncbi:MAG TPA: DNA mismatch repair protein MutS, partial [Nitrospiria bacterium]